MEIPKLKITEGKNLLLSSDTFTIENGESLFIRSTDPEGKTLFLRTLYLYLKMDKKKRELFRKRNDLFHWDIRNRRKLAGRGGKDVLLVELNPAILPLLTVNQNIMLPLINLNTRLKNKIFDYLSQFGLGTKQYLPSSHLSFTELKIVELIRAVILLPEVILIDDFDLSFPQVKLDKILEILTLIQKNGTIIIASGKTDNRSFQRTFSIANKQVVIK